MYNLHRILLVYCDNLSSMEKDNSFFLLDISLHSVHTTAECEALMEKGWKNRATGATLMNADSSRSHSIFTINVNSFSTFHDFF